jgi:hypothetical protein
MVCRLQMRKQVPGPVGARHRAVYVFSALYKVLTREDVIRRPAVSGLSPTLVASEPNESWSLVCIARSSDEFDPMNHEMRPCPVQRYTLQLSIRRYHQSRHHGHALISDATASLRGKLASCLRASACLPRPHSSPRPRPPSAISTSRKCAPAAPAVSRSALTVSAWPSTRAPSRCCSALPFTSSWPSMSAT